MIWISRVSSYLIPPPAVNTAKWEEVFSSCICADETVIRSCFHNVDWILTWRIKNVFVYVHQPSLRFAPSSKYSSTSTLLGKIKRRKSLRIVFGSIDGFFIHWCSKTPSTNPSRLRGTMHMPYGEDFPELQSNSLNWSLKFNAPIQINLQSSWTPEK